jgi:hypothetical protein
LSSPMERLIKPVQPNCILQLRRVREVSSILSKNRRRLD